MERGVFLASAVRPGGEITFHSGVDEAVGAQSELRPVRIHTLGRFTIAVGAKPVSASGKSRKRPLALLKALISLGGRDVSVSRFWECLWPDSDGDLAASNLAVTLHRLRDLLGSSAAIQQHDGKLTLNDRVSWVDIWCFERWANEGTARIGAGADDSEGTALLRRAFDLYDGHFLNFETEQPWMLPARLRLKSKFERLVTMLAERLESRHHHGAAAEICLRGIERDPLNEFLYRRLMRCYLQMGEHSSVLRTYRRCQEALLKGLSVQPAEATQQVYLDAIRADARALRAAAAPAGKLDGTARRSGNRGATGKTTAKSTSARHQIDVLAGLQDRQ